MLCPGHCYAQQKFEKQWVRWLEAGKNQDIARVCSSFGNASTPSTCSRNRLVLTLRTYSSVTELSMVGSDFLQKLSDFNVFIFSTF